MENSLNWVFKNVENVREFEDKVGRVKLFEAKTPGKGFEAGDWEGRSGIMKENEGLQLEDLAHLFFNFHVIVVAMVPHSLDFLRD